MAKPIVRLLLAGLLVSGGGLIGSQSAAWADAPWWCHPGAYPAMFDGNLIEGDYWVTCISPTHAKKLFGRIKEDRPFMPDAVHATDYFWFRDDMGKRMSARTCQDGDAIYIESQIEDGKPAQSARQEMHC
jgi:hypothetical protein